MADSFGLKIGIEGEKEFKNALREINQSFKVLASEMNLVSSQFDKNDKSIQALAARSQILNKEIDTQKDKITTLEDALKNAASSFGENDKRTQAWAIQLNNAKAELNGMERELGNNNRALRDAAFNLTDAEREALGLGKAINDTGKKTVGLNKALDETGKELNSTGKETKNLGNEMDETGKKSSIFAAALKANLAADAIKTGLSVLIDSIKAVGIAIKDYVGGSMEMSTKAAEAQTLLTQVMRNTLDASDEEIKSLVELAAAQEKVGVVSKTAQVTALAELASFVERKEALENMLPVMNDYVAYQYGTSASAEQARNVATALGKAIQGNIDGLAKQGFQLSKEEKDWFKFATEQERVAFVINMVSESMAGVNAALAQTDAGKMASLATVMDNTKIALGTMANEMKAQILGQMLPSISMLSDAFVGIIGSDGSVEDMAAAFDEVFDEIINIIDDFLPLLVEIGSNLIKALASGLSNNIDTIVISILSIINQLIMAILDLLPTILDAGTKLLFGLLDGIIKALPALIEAAVIVVEALAEGLGTALPELIPVIVEAVIVICQTLADNLPMILEAAMNIILGLADGLLAALPELIKALPAIIIGIVDFLIGAIPTIIALGMRLLVSLVGALPEIIAANVRAIEQIIKSIIDVFLGVVPEFVNMGSNLIQGLKDGILNAAGAVVDAAKNVGAQIVSGVKGFFGIKSPSTVFAGIGENLGEGIGVGFKKSMGKVSEDMKGAIPTEFDIAYNCVGRDLAQGIGSAFGNDFMSLPNDAKESDSLLRAISELRQTISTQDEEFASFAAGMDKLPAAFEGFSPASSGDTQSAAAMVNHFYFDNITVRSESDMETIAQFTLRKLQIALNNRGVRV